MEKRYVIGGEFLIDPQVYLQTENICNNTSLFSCGRAALFAILRAISANEGYSVILVPDYLCRSITHTIDDVGLEYRFYHIGEDLLPDWETLEPLLEKADAVLLVNYFGLVNVQPFINKVKEKRKDGNFAILLDCVQDFYGMENAKGYDFAFSSYRKWFPVPDGATIYNVTGKIIQNFSARNDFAQYKFAGNILKQFSSEVHPELYLLLLEQGEERLDKGYRCECSEISRRLIPILDFEGAAEKRKSNARILHEGLTAWGIRHLYQEDVVPMAIPIFLEKERRDEVRKRLFRDNIFAPVHWPWENKSVNGENVLYDIELSLVCDQRYGDDDMRRELAVLCAAIGSGGK